MLALPGFVRLLLLPPMGWDSLTYHALKAGMWVQNGGVDSMNGPGPWAYYRNMLAGGEVFLAWPMLALHSDALTWVADLYQYLGLGFCLIVLARRLGVREPLASTLAAFVLALPAVRLLVGSGYVEVGLLLALVSALAIGFSGCRPQGKLAPLACGALGVCAATKLPMVPLCGLLLVVLTWRSIIRGPASARAWSLVGVAAFAVALCPWLFLAYARTGLPFSPLPVTLGGIALGRATPEAEWWLRHTAQYSTSLVGELRVLAQVFQLPFIPGEALGVFAVVPLFIAPLGLATIMKRSAVAAASIGISVVVCVATYFSPALALVRHDWPVSSSRFLLPAVTLAAVLSAASCHRKPNLESRYAVVLFAFALVNMSWLCVYGYSSVMLLAMLVTTAGLAAMGGLAFQARHIQHTVSFYACVMLICTAACAGVGFLRGALRNDIFRQEFAVHPFPKYWVEAALAVDRPGVGRRIAVTSGPHLKLDNWFAYPFMGRELQNEVLYVPVSREGRIRYFGMGSLNDDFAAAADYESWRRRLRERGVTHVVSFLPPSLELRWMEEHPESFERIDGRASEWGLFSVRFP